MRNGYFIKSKDLVILGYHKQMIEYLNKNKINFTIKNSADQDIFAY